jgi:hypothetical protein
MIGLYMMYIFFFCFLLCSRSLEAEVEVALVSSMGLCFVVEATALEVIAGAWVMGVVADAWVVGSQQNSEVAPKEKVR